jgi:hypothetical protein
MRKSFTPDPHRFGQFADSLIRWRAILFSSGHKRRKLSGVSATLKSTIIPL